MYDIIIKYRDLQGTIETVTVKDYGIVQAIEQIRSYYEYRLLILSANYVDEDLLLNNLKK